MKHGSCYFCTVTAQHLLRSPQENPAKEEIIRETLRICTRHLLTEVDSKRQFGAYVAAHTLNVTKER